MNKQRIVIAESSQMLRKGFVQLINQLPYVDKVIELDDSRPIDEQIDDYSPTLVLINPLLLHTVLSVNPREVLGLSNNVHLVALVYTLFTTQYLQYFDAVITINDKLNDIAEKLKSLSNIKKINTVDSEELSDREKEILVTLVKGLSNKEIADYHNISIHTVITHRRNITRKLDIHSLSGLTVYAIVNKLVDLNDLKQ